MRRKKRLLFIRRIFYLSSTVTRRMRNRRLTFFLSLFAEKRWKMDFSLRGGAFFLHSGYFAKEWNFKGLEKRLTSLTMEERPFKGENPASFVIPPTREEPKRDLFYILLQWRILRSQQGIKRGRASLKYAWRRRILRSWQRRNPRKDGRKKSSQRGKWAQNFPACHYKDSSLAVARIGNELCVCLRSEIDRSIDGWMSLDRAGNKREKSPRSFPPESAAERKGA